MISYDMLAIVFIVLVLAAILSVILGVLERFIGKSPYGEFPVHPDEMLPKRTLTIASAYSGNGRAGFPILSRYGTLVYRGASQGGFPTFSISGNSIYAGASSTGFPLATVESSGYVRKGAGGNYIGYIVGNSVWRTGATTTEENQTVATSGDRMLLAAALLISGR